MNRVAGRVSQTWLLDYVAKLYEQLPDDLNAEQSPVVQNISSDMSPAFAKGVFVTLSYVDARKVRTNKPGLPTVLFVLPTLQTPAGAASPTRCPT